MHTRDKMAQNYVCTEASLCMYTHTCTHTHTHTYSAPISIPGFDTITIQLGEEYIRPHCAVFAISSDSRIISEAVFFFFF